MSEEKDPKHEVVKAIIATAKDDPDVQAAGRNLAKAAKTVTEFINVALLPLSAANWGVERARNYFKDDFQEEFKPYVEDIPIENIVEPPGEIAGPAMQGIAWSLDHTILKDMFMRLLASSMDSRKDVSHPAFVRVVQQLSPEEADLLNKTFNYFSTQKALPIVRLRVRTKGEQGFYEPLRHVAPIIDDDTGKLRTEDNFPFWLDNWHRLGIVDIRYGTWVGKDDEHYKWAYERPEYMDIHDNLEEGQSLDFDKGIVELTAFGAKLVEALK